MFGGPWTATGPNVKGGVFKAPILVRLQDLDANKGQGLTVGDAYDCVTCWYEETITAIPALSLLGTAVLLGGLLTAAIFRIRQKQANVAA